jgi:hypothetical protein
MYEKHNKVSQSNKATDYRQNLLKELKSSITNVDKANGLEYRIDGCGCMPCLCNRSAWTIVLSPAGIAAGVAAYGAAMTIELIGH